MSFNVKGPGAVILLFRLEYKTSVVCHNVYTKKVMHQSIPPAPRPPPRADPQELAFFLPWMANSRGWGLLSWPLGTLEPRRHAPVYGFSIDIKLLTLKLIECCKVICYG